MLIVYLGIAWFFGLWLASIVTLNWSVWLALAGAGLVTAVFLRRQQKIQWAAACVAVLALGAIRYGTAVPTIDDQHIAYLCGYLLLCPVNCVFINFQVPCMPVGLGNNGSKRTLLFNSSLGSRFRREAALLS